MLNDLQRLLVEDVNGWRSLIVNRWVRSHIHIVPVRGHGDGFASLTTTRATCLATHKLVNVSRLLSASVKTGVEL
jgi:hypothetical protein